MTSLPDLGRTTPEDSAAADRAGAAASSLRGLDYPTRKRYLAAVEQIAAWSARTSAEVLAAAQRMAVERSDDDLGEMLLGEARPQLERQLGARVPWHVRGARMLRRHATGTYFALMLALTAAVPLALTVVLLGAGAGGLSAALAALLVLAPSLVLGRAVADALIMAATFPPQPLPALQIGAKVAPEHRTAVVYPLLAGSIADVDDVLANMERNYQRNPLEGVIHCILSDGADASQAVAPTDAEIVARLVEGARELDRRHGRGLFHVFHRERRWNAAQNTWMGWERKRGKLLELVALVRGSGDTSFKSDVGDHAALRGVRYVLTLDADTQAPEGGIALLLGARAHPLNRPRFGAGSRRVVRGFGIIAPRMVINASEAGALATAVFGRHVEVRRETRPSALQDFVGEELFVGKGVVDVDAFHAALDGLLPDNAVLSHDKLEGMFARTAVASDIVFHESAPFSWLSYRTRLHRWARGDLQLVPWLLPWVRDRSGAWRRNELSIVHRWRLAVDIASHLRFPSIAALLVAGWFGLLHGRLAHWALLAVVLVVADLLITLLFVLGFASRGRLTVPCDAESEAADASAPGRLATAAGVGMRNGVAALVAIACMLDVFVTVADAAVRTAYRMTVGRRLLEWTTAAHADRSVQGAGAGQRWRSMAVSVALAAVVTASLLILRPAALPWAAPWLLAWMLAPQFVR